MSAGAQQLSGALAVPERHEAVPARTRRVWRSVGRRPLSAAAALGLIVIVLVALVGPALPLPDPAAQSLRDRLSSPMSRDRNGTLHLAGTDQLGRDVLSRTIRGARISLGIALATVVISGIVGSTLGLLAGYRGGLVDQVAMRIVDLQMAFPPLLLALFLLYMLGATLVNLVALLAILSWPAYARVVRAETLRVRGLPFVESAIAAGCTNRRLLLRHVLPQIQPVLIVVAVFEIAAMILAEAGLSFLGFGVQPPNPSWGAMIAEGQDHISTGAWWLFAVPGMAIFVTVLLVKLASAWMQDLLAGGGTGER